ncbi:MAG: GAK system CofD-like protein [Thermodesulfobacteriota bacterium]|nr:GAK system CofD-like protein [Thermodesulfobacteriota bacterium]
MEQKTTSIFIRRKEILPNSVKLMRYAKAPELGPRLLFFSGGTALRHLSSVLIKYTYNSIHLITPFDSGGSSATLRRAFKMLAIGDIRNRLMALADQTLQGNPCIFRLFAHRFSKDESPANLISNLEKMIAGKHCLVVHLPDPMRKIIRHHLLRFRELMPADFDLRGASIGNLILTAGFLENRRHPDQVIYIFSKLVEVRGIVRPVINENYHLAVELEDGRIVEGQHQITGKEVEPLAVPVKRLFLIDREKNGREITVGIRNKIKELIFHAELICYPMGSFYTSLLATLLPGGVGTAISQNSCPKVFIPSTGYDPESMGMTVTDQALALLAALRNNAPDIGVGELLNFVIIDSKRGTYNVKPNKKELAALGIEVIDVPLVSRESEPLIDSTLLLGILLSLA